MLVASSILGPSTPVPSAAALSRLPAAEPETVTIPPCTMLVCDFPTLFRSRASGTNEPGGSKGDLFRQLLVELRQERP